MPEYTVGHKVEGKDAVERFFNFPLWFGVGPKLYKVGEDVFGAEVKKSPPGEKKIVEKVIEKVTGAPKVGFEVLQKVLLGSNQANPSSAELPAGIGPTGKPYPPAAEPKASSAPAPVVMLEMWNTDP